MKRDLLKAVVAARAARVGIAVITTIATGEQRLVRRCDIANDPLAATLADAFRFDQSGMHEGEFIQIHNPPLKLVIIGAVLIAQSVIPMAQMAGYDVTVIDPRGAFATDARFPGVTLHADWPQDVLPKVGHDARTALLALTHDPKIDDPALQYALASDMFYIGALGSKKTQASRLERLTAAGIKGNQLSRIHGPIGLAIGAKGGPEIAISIMAEMTRALRLGS